MKLPKVETLIVVVFLGCVLLWAISKCSAKRSDLLRDARDTEENEDEERPPRRDTIVVQQPAPPAEQLPVNTRNPTPAAAPQTSPAAAKGPADPPVNTRKPTKQEAAPEAGKATGKYSTLFVTIDGLKVRKEPGLKGETVAKLELYEPVTFLNKKTDWTQEISLGYEKVTDHWVKIRTASGKEGWVFGAGVHYYKLKRKGVMD